MPESIPSPEALKTRFDSVFKQAHSDAWKLKKEKNADYYFNASNDLKYLRSLAKKIDEHHVIRNEMQDKISSLEKLLEPHHAVFKTDPLIITPAPKERLGFWKAVKALFEPRVVSAKTIPEKTTTPFVPFGNKKYFYHPPEKGEGFQEVKGKNKITPEDPRFDKLYVKWLSLLPQRFNTRGIVFAQPRFNFFRRRFA